MTFGACRNADRSPAALEFAAHLTQNARVPVVNAPRAVAAMAAELERLAYPRRSSPALGLVGDQHDGFAAAPQPAGEVPVGCVIVLDSEVVATAGSTVVLRSRTEETSEAVLEGIDASLAKKVLKRQLDRARADIIRGRISATLVGTRT